MPDSKKTNLKQALQALYADPSNIKVQKTLRDIVDENGNGIIDEAEAPAYAKAHQEIIQAAISALPTAEKIKAAKELANFPQPKSKIIILDDFSGLRITPEADAIIWRGFMEVAQAAYPEAVQPTPFKSVSTVKGK